MQDIGTHAGRAEEMRLPHQALLRVAWLEMGKYRRVIERRSARHRAQNIDRRIKEIDAEQERLMSGVRMPAQPCSSDSENGCYATESSFRIRY